MWALSSRARRGASAFKTEWQARPHSCPFWKGHVYAELSLRSCKQPIRRRRPLSNRAKPTLYTPIRCTTYVSQNRAPARVLLFARAAGEILSSHCFPTVWRHTPIRPNISFLFLFTSFFLFRHSRFSCNSSLTFFSISRILLLLPRGPNSARSPTTIDKVDRWTVVDYWLIDLCFKTNSFFQLIAFFDFIAVYSCLFQLTN